MHQTNKKLDAFKRRQYRASQRTFLEYHNTYMKLIERSRISRMRLEKVLYEIIDKIKPNEKGEHIVYSDSDDTNFLDVIKISIYEDTKKHRVTIDSNVKRNRYLAIQLLLDSESLILGRKFTFLSRSRRKFEYYMSVKIKGIIEKIVNFELYNPDFLRLEDNKVINIVVNDYNYLCYLKKQHTDYFHVDIINDNNIENYDCTNSKVNKHLI